MTLDEAFSRLHRLPPIPAVLQEIMASFNKPDVDIAHLVHKLGNDQALTASMLRVANSSFYGFPRRISTLQDAVVVMGLASVRTLVISAGMMHVFHASPGHALDRIEFWKRCFRVASYAKSVATCLKQSIEVAYTAGLLHDIGLLVLDTCLPEAYAAAIDRAKAEGCELIAAEIPVLGFHHGALGGEIARRWNFPLEIEQVIRDCPTGSEGCSAPLTLVIRMAMTIDQGSSVEQVLALLPEEVRDVYGLDAEWMAANIPTREQLEREIADFLP